MMMAKSATFPMHRQGAKDIGASAIRRGAAEWTSKCRQQHERDDHRQVFYQEPSDRHPSRLGLHGLAFLQSAQEDDGAGDREGRPKTRFAQRPSPESRDGRAECGGDRHLPDCSGQGDPPHGQELTGGEVDADAEHQQDDADFGQLWGKVGVGDEAWREWPHGYACQQVAHKGRQSKAHRHQGKDETPRSARPRSWR